MCFVAVCYKNICQSLWHGLVGFLVVVVCFSFRTRADLKDSVIDHKNRDTLAMYLKLATYFGWEEWVVVVPVVEARHFQQVVITSEW